MCIRDRPKALAQWLEQLRDEDSLDAAHPGWRTPLRTLRERGLVERQETGQETGTGLLSQVRRESEPDPVYSFSPNPAQQAAIDAIHAAQGTCV